MTTLIELTLVVAALVAVGWVVTIDAREQGRIKEERSIYRAEAELLSDHCKGDPS